MVIITVNFIFYKCTLQQFRIKIINKIQTLTHTYINFDSFNLLTFILLQ